MGNPIWGINRKQEKENPVKLGLFLLFMFVLFYVLTVVIFSF